MWTLADALFIVLSDRTILSKVRTGNNSQEKAKNSSEILALTIKN
jgi:hypothetical protein